MFYYICLLTSLSPFTPIPDIHRRHTTVFKISCQYDIMIPKYFSTNLLRMTISYTTTMPLSHLWKLTVFLQSQLIFKTYLHFPGCPLKISVQFLPGSNQGLWILSGGSVWKISTFNFCLVLMYDIDFGRVQARRLRESCTSFVHPMVSQWCPLSFTFKPVFPLKWKLGLEACLCVG